MSDETKDKSKFEIPMMPIFGVDIGERLGALAEGQKQLRSDFQRLEVRLDVIDAKFEAKIDALDTKTDKMVVAINRLDERMIALSEGRKSDHTLLIGLWVTVIAGVILQFFLK